MKGPSLQKTAALSAALHLTAFIVTFIIMRHASQNILPSPYMVSLVGPGRSRGGEEAPARKAEDQAAEEAAPARTAVVDETRVEDRIAELKAKKKLEDIMRIRKEVATVRGKGSEAAGGQQQRAQTTGAPGGSGADTYISKITQEIHDNWGWPSSAARSGLEAIISISIDKDGSIKIIGVEKRSGNRLFDNFALDALRKASPVTPPPYSMEIGIRFYP